MNKETVYNFKVKNIKGEDSSLSQYSGKVLLIVNVASQCGYTKQYKGLEELYKKHQKEGLEILGFPCNQFGQQEPGSDEEIKTFCETKFNVSFPLFSKIDVNGADTHPLYVFLKTERPGIFKTEAIKWNFTKFLVDRQGEVIGRFGSNVEPSDLEKDIIAALMTA